MSGVNSEGHIKALEGEGFTGSVSKTFAIVGASVDNASVKVGNGVYTGEAVTPDHTVTLGGRRKGLT